MSYAEQFAIGFMAVLILLGVVAIGCAHVAGMRIRHKAESDHLALLIEMHKRGMWP